ncbi:MAG: xanthine dehydrogenase small subunit [Methylobacteriaceae bacterium]|nr:xanthine dehydrogenase small subunit [Methylobacteriaceae bacterium]
MTIISQRTAFHFIFRDSLVEVPVADPKITLLDWLRLDRRATGTKEGCAEGDCGACTVVLRRARGDRLVHEPVNACILLLGQVDGAEVLTIEDLTEENALHPVQEALAAWHGSQCGFCTPGIVMSLFALYCEAPRPVSRQAVCDQLAGNLCRCTGYRPIIDAALEACRDPPGDRFARHREAALARFRALDNAADVFVGDETRFFAAPASEDGLAALCERHPDALLVAGATDVGLAITKALQDPAKIIWLGRVRELGAIERRNGALAFGATVSHERAARELAGIDPDLGELMRRFGSIQVRVSGTVGGNIANASPIGDLPPALIALGATLELRKGAQTRTMALEDFFVAYRRQDRKPGEYVRRVLVPRLQANEAFRAIKVTKRFDEDISAVMGAFKFTLSGHTVASARVAYGGMAGTPRRAPRAEAALVGADLDEKVTWAAALEALDADYTPMTDHRASAAYRGLVARNILFKALAEAGGLPRSATRIIEPSEIRDAAE